MKNLLNKRGFFPFAILLLLSIVVLGVQLTYSAYIRRSYIKAVIATNETEKLFGSNLLYGFKNEPSLPEGTTIHTNDSWMSVYPFTVAATENPVEVPIKIYNYLAEDKDRVNQLDVSYIISFKATTGSKDVENLSDYQVKVGGIFHNLSSSNTTYYLGKGSLTSNRDDAAKQILAGRKSNTNTYTIVMPGQDVGKVSFSVIVERVSNNVDDTKKNYGTDLLYLAARVAPSLPAKVEAASLEGYFNNIEKTKPKDFDAYNYNIKLSGASKMVTLEWNSALLELDPFFKEKYGADPNIDNTSNVGKVTFEIDPGVTMVQFYRKGDMEDKNWAELGVKVF